MEAWAFLSVPDEHGMKLKVRFSNPIFVSSYNRRDLLKVTVLEGRLFIAQKDRAVVVDGYEVEPHQLRAQAASDADYAITQAAGAAVASGLALGVAVPVLFKCFTAATGTRSWAFLNFLQLLGNLVVVGGLVLPAPAQEILDGIYGAAYFKVFESPAVR